MGKNAKIKNHMIEVTTELIEKSESMRHDFYGYSSTVCQGERSGCKSHENASGKCGQRAGEGVFGACINHSVFIKIVHRRLPFRANHRQNSRQICQTHIILRVGILKHHAQKFNIILTFPALLSKLSNRIIPLVKNNHKLVSVLESPSRRRCSWRISAGERIQARFLRS